MAKEIHFNTESRENLRKGVDILANAVSNIRSKRKKCYFR